MMLSAPAVELRPYSVPCGPFSTSMRSTSNMSNAIIAIEATYTWSTYTPALGLLAAPKSLRPTPRIVITGIAPGTCSLMSRFGHAALQVEDLLDALLRQSVARQRGQREADLQIALCRGAAR